MGMLNERGNNRLMAVMVAALILGIVVALASCHAPAPVVITQRDSTHTERVMTYRDTTVVVPGDQAVLKVGSEVSDIRRLVEGLRGEVRTIRGANQASLRMSATHDTLTVMALCDALQLKFDSVLVENRTLQSTVRSQAHFLAAQPEQTKPMPAWAKGTALAAGSVAGALFLIALLPTLKQLFHGKA